MALTIVSAAYPLVPVGLETVGGSEQVLANIDLALVKRNRPGDHPSALLTGESDLEGSGRALRLGASWCLDKI